MSYEIEFKGTKAEKEKAALKATKTYLGNAVYLTMRRLLVDHAITTQRSTAKLYRDIRFVCMMRGVQGYYPVRAVARDALKIVANCKG